MKQALMLQPGIIEFKNVEEPGQLGPRDILLKIKRIGVCGSDILVWKGEHPFTDYPIVQGHEYCGEVVAVGDKVTLVKTGDMATARPQLVCGTCIPCVSGRYNICSNLKVQGFQSNGCAQEYFVVPEERAVKIPCGLSHNQGAFTEPVAVAIHAVNVPAAVENENVVVFGAGTIGNLVAQCLIAKGAAKVLITDLNEFRLNVAKNSGVKHTVNLEHQSFEDALESVFGREGFGLAFEASGAEKPIMEMVKNINKGGTIVILGVAKRPVKIDMAIVCEHELQICGSMMYKHEDYIQAVDYMEKGLINTDNLVTDEFLFEDYPNAYEHINKNAFRTMKVMIKLD